MLHATRFWSPHFWFRTLKLAAKCLDTHLFSCSDKNARMAQSISSSKWKQKNISNKRQNGREAQQQEEEVTVCLTLTHFRNFSFLPDNIDRDTISILSDKQGYHPDGPCHCGLNPPPHSLLKYVMHYVGVNVNVAIILEGKRALGELSFVTGFPKSLHQRHWVHLPMTLPHTKGARLNISCFLDYFGGERSPWSDLVFSNKCALCHCSLLRDNTA